MNGHSSLSQETDSILLVTFCTRVVNVPFSAGLLQSGQKEGGGILPFESLPTLRVSSPFLCATSTARLTSLEYISGLLYALLSAIQQHSAIL